MLSQSRVHPILLLLAGTVVAAFDSSCVPIRYVYDVDSFDAKSEALSEAHPEVQFAELAYTGLGGDLESFARSHKCLEVKAAGVTVQCAPAIQTAEIQDPVMCVLFIVNNTDHEIGIDERSIYIAHDLALGGARKRKPISALCEVSRVPLRPIKPGEQLPVILEFQKDNTKRKSTLQFTIRTGANDDLTYEFIYKGAKH